jgi:hypothetical protein
METIHFCLLCHTEGSAEDDGFPVSLVDYLLITHQKGPNTGNRASLSRIRAKEDREHNVDPANSAFRTEL